MREVEYYHYAITDNPLYFALYIIFHCHFLFIISLSLHVFNRKSFSDIEQHACTKQCTKNNTTK